VAVLDKIPNVSSSIEFEGYQTKGLPNQVVQFIPPPLLNVQLIFF